MPTTIESALVLIVLIAPGFIASRVKNSLVAYRLPSAFHETVEAVILSAVLVPAWLIFAGYLLRARNQWLMAWRSSTTPSITTVLGPLLIVCTICFVIAPLVGVVYAVVQTKRPHATVGSRVLRVLHAIPSSEEGPEVWDQVFGRRDVTPWVRVWFKDRTAIEGVVRYAGVSPASKQLYLSAVAGVPNSLVRLDVNGAVVEDLSEKQGEGIWVDVGAEVQMVEVFG